VLEYKLAVVHLILNIIVVDINVFGALIVALTRNKLEGGLVVTIELNRIDVFAYITNLLEELLKLYSFFCSVRKANVLSFSS
jgi:ABC-type transporter Mla maintaining outer membrane lipid asymmetry permease subunit MlaE